MKRPPLPVVPPDRAILEPTPKPPGGVVAWNMNTTCNYRCSYCTQRFLDDRTRWASDVPRFLEGFRRLAVESGVSWEVKLSGGEPFLHPRFLDVVAGLRVAGFRVGVVTNLSAAREKVLAFVDAAGPALTVLSCSLHLEYVDDEEALTAFVDTCVSAAERIAAHGAGSLVVTSVATRSALPRLGDLRRRFVDARLSFKVQPEKQDRDVIDYAPSEVEELVRLGGHNGTGRLAHDFLGQPCWAGARSLIVDDRGEVYRCYPARRHKSERLGNLLDGSLRLHETARPCLYAYCNCTVPIARGMMPVASARDRFLAQVDEVDEETA